MRFNGVEDRAVHVLQDREVVDGLLYRIDPIAEVNERHDDGPKSSEEVSLLLCVQAEIVEKRLVLLDVDFHLADVSVQVAALSADCGSNFGLGMWLQFRTLLAGSSRR